MPEDADKPEQTPVEEPVEEFITQEAPVEEEKFKELGSMYAYVKDAWKSPSSDSTKELYHQRLIEYRRGGSFTRVEKPTRIDRARALGYKAKQGYVIVRAKVRKGGLRKHTIKGGRRAKRKGMNKITMKKSIQRIAEERTQKRYPNMEVLNSYWVAEDGTHKYYEVILVDPHHPVIKADPKINWIGKGSHKNRVYRGKTSAGKKGRGLTKKGKGSEKSR